jgi:hypothetical protein
MLCGLCKNRRFRGNHRRHHQGDKNRRAGNNGTVTSNQRTLRRNVPKLVTLMMEAIRSSETSVLTRATRRDISEDGILHSHRRDNLKLISSFLTAFNCNKVLGCSEILRKRKRLLILRQFPDELTVGSRFWM